MFKMPKLRYEPEDLSPNISKETFEFHFGKHTKSYIDNVNKLINLPTGQHFKNMTLEGIICESNGALYNNASQVWNHTFYWLGLNPLSRRVTLESRSTLDAAIKHNFGDTKHFKEQFKASATSLFGSGWTWLAKDNSGKLFFVNTTNGDGLLKSDSIPLVVCDVWEHAYYIDYRNDRGRYFDQFFELINWSFVESNFTSSKTLALTPSLVD